MLLCRPFQNTDPPSIAEIWRSRAGQCGLKESISVDLFEQLVFGKIYFDCRGLILAFDGDRPVGFAHAGFGPNQQRSGISTESGVICMLVVRPDCAEAEVADALLRQCESYLRSRGAKVLYGGAVWPMVPFYLGLYGGSQMPGVLDSDTLARELYQSHGYQEIERTVVFRRSVSSSFHPPMDRRQMQLKRRLTVQTTSDPPPRDWWEACTIGDFDLTRFELVPRGGGPHLATVTVRALEPGRSWEFARACGLMELAVEPSHRRQGLATFLLAESFRLLVRQGVTAFEAQTELSNSASVALFRKLGLEQQEEGIVFSKHVSD